MPKTAAALSDEDIRRKYYETAGHQMWITEMQLDPLQLIVCDDGSGKYYRVGVTLDGGDINFADPAEVAIHYVDAGAKLSAIVYDNRAESLSGITAAAPPEVITTTSAVAPPAADPAEVGRQIVEAMKSYPSGGLRAPAPPPPPPPPVAPDVSPAGAAIRKMAATTQTPPPASTGGGSVSATDKEASGMPFDAAKLREALGLTETASADDALTAFAGALSSLGGQGTATPADTPPADSALAAPVVVPQLVDGNRPILLDPSQLAALQESARKGETAWAQLRRNERDGVLDEAIRLGKFPASRREYWVQLWDRDPDGTRQAVHALAANVIPVLSAGYTGDEDAAHRSASDQAYEGLFGKENH